VSIFFQEKNLDPSMSRFLVCHKPARDDPGIIHDQNIPGLYQFRKVAEESVPDTGFLTDEEPGLIRVVQAVFWAISSGGRS